PGVGRVVVVLASQRGLRRVPDRDVLRGARRPAEAGGRGRRRGMTADERLREEQTATDERLREEQAIVVSRATSDAKSVDAPKAPKAGKRDVWIVFFIVPAFYTAFGVIFFALARTMPPPRPDVTTDQMVDFFHQHSTTIKIGFGILVLIVGGSGV